MHTGLAERDYGYFVLSAIDGALDIGKQAHHSFFEENEVRQLWFFAGVAVAARRAAMIAYGILVAERRAAFAFGILVSGLSAAFAFSGKSRYHGSLLCQAKFDSRSAIR